MKWHLQAPDSIVKPLDLNIQNTKTLTHNSVFVNPSDISEYLASALLIAVSAEHKVYSTLNTWP